MIRIICVDVDCAASANIGGPVHERHKTFDIDAPELEAWLAAVDRYVDRSIIGVEVLPTVKAVTK